MHGKCLVILDSYMSCILPNCRLIFCDLCSSKLCQLPRLLFQRPLDPSSILGFVQLARTLIPPQLMTCVLSIRSHPYQFSMYAPELFLFLFFKLSFQYEYFLNKKLKNITTTKIKLSGSCKSANLSNLRNGSQRQVQISKESCIQ